MSLGAYILDFQPLNPSNIDSLDFSYPMDNGIRIISPDYLALVIKPPYYGDMINLKFWKLLGLDFGKPKVKIVCMGDSLTAGHPYTTNKPVESSDLFSWTHTFRTLSGYEIVNKGVSGQTSADMLARFNADVIAESPDYCIIECGTNDGNITSPTNIPLANCLSNIQDMVDLCLANGITPIFAHYSEQVSQLMSYGLSNADANYLHTYTENVKAFEQSLGYKFLDLTSTVVSSSGVDMSKFSSDFIHPNTTGYQVWGSYVNSSLGNLKRTVSTCLTLQSGYKYVYNHNTREFDAYDATGTNFVHITNIDSVADMNIDFTIHKSHQFEIIVSPDGLGDSRFIFTAQLLKKIIYGQRQNCINEGLNNKYIPDRVRPYGALDFDNPYFKLQYLGDIVNSFARSYHEPDITVGKLFNLQVLNYLWDINWSKNSPMNYFYSGRYILLTAIKLFQTMNTQMIDGYIIVPPLSKNLFPNLMPVQKGGEVQNNRPAYVPHLILGWLAFVYNHTIDLEDTFEIPVFDLSPRYS